MTIREHFYTLKQLFVSLWRYPKLHAKDGQYNTYWHDRHLTAHSLNDFQRDRAHLVLQVLERASSIMDIGCGNGAVLAHIHRHKPLSYMYGVDVSTDALQLAHENGVETLKADVSLPSERAGLPSADYITLFEVLEHVHAPEDLLQWAIKRAHKGVFFSVPNTGFLFHRLRLVFGRFPLQWRVHPSEHIRFWTWRDMKWWLREMGISQYTLHGYKGIPLLRSLVPSLFAQGLFVIIKKN